MRLIVENKTQEKTGELARQLMSQAQQELRDTTLEKKVLEFIKAVVIDKFTTLSREEMEMLLDIGSLRKSKIYQEAREEGIEEGVIKNKLETIPILQELGLNIEEIAERLKLDVEMVRKILNSN
jgi:predicted transposase/invertase (TIGR01784 family)